ncbi:syntaxin-binding protein 4-like [Leucoraja erinacea]|uniref:syntaxin-binding protein 4-like n=1 Tax=Leucoraja erinaceus TaxID=7782 RepID=UPI00245468EE|nr:syntaxin-binding protein 4-like [Leucoraja erinacea]
MDCQLRKSEAARKTFQLSTGKLLQFVEKDLPTDTAAARTSACYSPAARRFSGPPAAQSLSRSSPGNTSNNSGKVAGLSSQAQELCTSVRALIEADCLPYGWEESHTTDGTKYFIK